MCNELCVIFFAQAIQYLLLFLIIDTVHVTEILKYTEDVVVLTFRTFSIHFRFYVFAFTKKRRKKTKTNSAGHILFIDWHHFNIG